MSGPRLGTWSLGPLVPWSLGVKGQRGGGSEFPVLGVSISFVRGRGFGRFLERSQICRGGHRKCVWGISRELPPRGQSWSCPGAWRAVRLQ